MEGVGWEEEIAETASCVVGLGPAFLGEFYAVVRNGLVDVAVLVPFGLAVLDSC